MLRLFRKKSTPLNDGLNHTLQLPRETLREIFSLLDLNSIKAVLKVDKRFHNISQEELAKSFIPHIDFKVLCEVLKKTCEVHIKNSTNQKVSFFDFTNYDIRKLIACNIAKLLKQLKTNKVATVLLVYSILSNDNAIENLQDYIANDMKKNNVFNTFLLNTLFKKSKNLNKTISRLLELWIEYNVSKQCKDFNADKHTELLKNVRKARDSIRLLIFNDHQDDIIKKIANITLLDFIQNSTNLFNLIEDIGNYQERLKIRETKERESRPRGW